MEGTLLTAFEPFGGSEINASLEVAYLLAGCDSRIQMVTLPVTRFDAGRLALTHLCRRLEAGRPPQLFLSLGEAGPEPVIRLEKVAINWDDYRIPDNAGNQPRDAAIYEGAPDAYFATLPVARLARNLSGRTPLPVVVSLSAGAYLCNHTAYTVLHFLRRQPVCGYSFLHLPCWRPGDGRAALQAIASTVAAVIEEGYSLTSPPPEPPA